MARSNSHFQRGAGVYTCISCERRTRGDADSAQCQLCAECFDLAGWDNHFNDRGETPTPAEMADFEKTLAKIARLGGNTERVKSLNDYIWHTVHPKTLRAQQRFARRAKSLNDKETTMATSKAKAKTTSKKRTSKKRASTKKTAAAKPAATVGLNDSTGKYTGANADWNIEALPAKERVAPREGSLRAQCLAKMQKDGVTVDSAIALCRAFDKKRGKKTNEDTVSRRGYELIRLVAISNGYGAKQKEDKITVA